jgi:hypothetical protein
MSARKRSKARRRAVRIRLDERASGRGRVDLATSSKASADGFALTIRPTRS